MGLTVLPEEGGGAGAELSKVIHDDAVLKVLAPQRRDGLGLEGEALLAAAESAVGCHAAVTHAAPALPGGREPEATQPVSHADGVQKQRWGGVGWSRE